MTQAKHTASPISSECTCSANEMPFGKCCKRIAFERWYDSQKDGRIEPWDVFKAGAQFEAEAIAKAGGAA